MSNSWLGEKLSNFISLTPVAMNTWNTSLKFFSPNSPQGHLSAWQMEEFRDESSGFTMIFYRQKNQTAPSLTLVSPHHAATVTAST